MDIQSKTIFGPVIRKNQSKIESNKVKSGTFKSTTSSQKQEVNTPQQTFAVHALESIMMDLSHSNAKHRQAIDYGFDLLNQLEALKNQLLVGEVSLSDLENIRSILQLSRPTLEDSTLEEILQEIETRVLVELAKLGK